MAMKNVADIWPLAPLQELMLTHALADGDSHLLVEQFHATLTGDLDSALFRQAWEQVVARHPLLRAAFAWEGLKKPVQVVRREVQLPWTDLDWHSRPEGERRGLRDELLQTARQQPLDLTRPPLMRFWLVRLASQEWLFVWNCHHLIVDGWSLSIVIREVFACYAALKQGQSPPWEPCGSFADYLKWLAAQSAEQASGFWQQQLSPPSPLCALPLRDESAIAHNVAHAEREVRLSSAASAQLVDFARSCRVSPSACVEAAWAVLLSRHAESTDVRFGITVAGRPPQVARVETVVGAFANNIPRRIMLSPKETASSLCQRLYLAQVDAQPFEHCSAQQIAAAADAPVDSLFNTLVVYENYPLQAADDRAIAAVTVRDLHGTATANYALSLVALPGREFTFRLLHDATRYSAASADRLLAQFVALLENLTQQADKPVGMLRLVSPQDAEVLRSLTVDADVQRILDSARQPAPLGMPGELWIPARKSPAPSQAETITDPLDASGSRLLLSTGYRAALQPDGEIEFLGPASARTGDLLRCGRKTIAAAELTAVLSLSPLVADVAVVSHLDRDGRSQVAAYVVPAADSAVAVAADQSGLLIAELRSFLGERVSSAFQPTAWRTVAAIPRTPEGAIDRPALPSPLTPRPELSQSFVAPRDAWESRVAAVWSEVLGIEAIGMTDGFLELGGNSSQAIALLTRLEAEFGRRLPLSALFAQPTVEHVARLLKSASGNSEETLIVPLRPGGKQAPLFCIHPAGGTVFCYLELAQLLDEEIPVYGIQARGVDGLSAPHETIEQMAADYCRAIKKTQITGPYRLCGWSTGGVIAFEVAQQLLAAGDDVSLLALLDAAIPGPDQSFDEHDLVPMLQLMFPSENGDQLKALRELPVNEQVDYFRDRALAARLLLNGAGDQGTRSVYDVFEANMKAVVAYQPQSANLGLTLIRVAEHATPMHADPHLGWGSWTSGDIATHVVNGSHLTMLQAPAVTEVADHLNRYFAERQDSCCTAELATRS